MKKLLIVFLLIPTLLQAQKPVESEITDVIVYQNGAKLTNETTFYLTAGTHDVIIRGVPLSIDQNSLQAQLSKSVVLLSATFRTAKLENKNIPKRTKALEDSIAKIKMDIGWLKSEKTVYEGEQKLILANQKLGSNEEKVTVDEIIKLTEFYRSRITDINKKIFNIDNTISKLNKELTDLLAKLQKLSYSEKKTIGEVVLSVTASKTSTVKAKLSYLSYQANWSPIYDIRAGKSEDPVTLIYKANVNQTTGLDWDDVNLTISTGNPRANNNRPTMYPWYINFYVPVAVNQYYKKSAVQPSQQNLLQRSRAVEEEMVMSDKEELSEASVPFDVGVSSNRISSQYEISVPQNIPSDNQVHLVAIQEYELQSKYMYHAIPKLDPGTFLIAKVADYGKYNLLAGQANLFFEGMYIGQSYLNPVTTVDSMLLSLGRDDKINIKRNQLTDLTARQTVGSNVKETKAFEIAIRNNNSFEIELDLMDQLPISQNKEIEVKLEEAEGAKFDEAYGSLLWRLKVKPGETKRVKFIYTVKYPKDKQIQGL